MTRIVGYLSQSNTALDAAANLYTTYTQPAGDSQVETTLNTAANLFSSINVPVDFGMSEQSSDDKKKSNSASATTSVQEKDRRAQKRFRERQKAKMKDMTEQLDEINAELDKLKVENDSLRNRNSILEKVLSLRNDHIRMLQDDQHVFDLGRQYYDNSILLKDEKMIAGDASDARDDCDWSMVSSDPSAIKSMSPAKMVSFWKAIVRDLGNILVKYDNLPESDTETKQKTMEQLCETLDVGGQICMQTAVLHPTNMQYLIASTLDGGASGTSPSDRSFWASVVASMHLTDEQESQVVALRDIFVSRMGSILGAREGILKNLRSVAVPDRLVALQSVISETLRVNEATQALKSNLQEEHLCGMEFIGTVFKTIFTPLQKARAIVQAYPFYPDVYQISSIIAEKRQKRIETGGYLPLLEGSSSKAMRV